jgi:tetratricopeptide (TPR) repeat protein
MNEPQKAIENLNSCLKLDFTYMYAYREKGIALYNQAKYEDAIKVLNRAVTIQNNFDEGYYWLGKCYEKLNKKEKAAESYQKALLYDKNFIEAREALDKLEK